MIKVSLILDMDYRHTNYGHIASIKHFSLLSSQIFVSTLIVSISGTFVHILLKLLELMDISAKYLTVAFGLVCSKFTTNGFRITDNVMKSIHLLFSFEEFI
jgi:hypothetical protein